MNQMCFAARNGQCIALTRTACDGCRFFKTQEQFYEDRRKAMRRLRSLPDELRQSIGEQYDSGGIPGEEGFG